MVTVPGVRAVTNPVVAFTEAIAGLLHDHVPPLPVVENGVDAVKQTGDAPAMVPALGAGNTTMVLVADVLPHTFVTV